MKYAVEHTVDQLGGRYNSAVRDAEYESLEEAVKHAERLTAAGQCGIVVRLSDDAVLAPDGTWV
jgi:hypothetical protein